MMGDISAICTSWIISLGVTLSALLLVCQAGWIPEISDSLEDYGFENTVLHSQDNEKHSFPRILHDNGMLHLVLHELATELLRELDKQDHELDVVLSQKQRDILFQKVKQFYTRILDHPALTNDRIAFAQTKPDFHKYVPSTSLESSNHKVSKRSGLMDEVCRSHADWEIRTMGETRDRRNVELYDGQFFYVTSCLQSREECDHISTRYVSQCRERSSWTIAYVKEEDDTFSWDWISVNTCCSCATALI